MRQENPYSQVARNKRKRQPHRVSVLLVQLCLIAVVGWLLREPLAIYLVVNTSHRLEQLLFRTGAFVVAVTALQTYAGVVRHPERSIFGVHPVRAVLFLRSIGREQFAITGLWVLMCIGIWSGVNLAWLPWIVVFLLSSWVGGMGVGYGVHLGAVWAAMSPGLAPTLDAIRGQNPREQAAFIYAPGVALGIMGVAIIFASGATRLVIEGQANYVGWMFLPLVLGIIGWLVAEKLATKYLVRAGMVLADIDAHWGMLEEGDEERSVYLDWLAKDNPHRLRLLRNSWRLQRWVTIVLWVLGTVTGLMVMVGSTSLAFGTCAVASVLFTGFPTRLWSAEPRWLQWSLGIDGLTQWKAVFEVTTLVWMGFCLPVCLLSWWSNGATTMLYYGVPLVSMIPILGLVGWWEGQQRGLLFRYVGVFASIVLWGSIWLIMGG